MRAALDRCSVGMPVETEYSDVRISTPAALLGLEIRLRVLRGRSSSPADSSAAAALRSNVARMTSFMVGFEFNERRLLLEKTRVGFLLLTRLLGES